MCDKDCYKWPRPTYRPSSTTRQGADLRCDGEAFMLVDHNVVPPEGAVEVLAACPRIVHPFPLYGGADSRPNNEELGCTEFSSALLRRLPTLVDDCAGVVPDPHEAAGQQSADWMWVAVQVRSGLRDAGARVHEHRPTASHIRGVADVPRRKVRRIVLHIAPVAGRGGVSVTPPRL